MITTDSKIKKFDKVAYQREYMNRQAANARDVKIRDCANMDRRLERLSCPIKFLRGYWPNIYWRKFTRDQEEATWDILDCMRYNADNIFVAQRSDWKTVLLRGLTHYGMMKLYCRFPVWFGANATSSKQSFDSIKERFVTPEFASDFTEVSDPIIALKGRQKHQTHLGRDTKIKWTEEFCSLPVIYEVPWTGRPSIYSALKFTHRSLDSAVRGINVGMDSLVVQWNAQELAEHPCLARMNDRPDFCPMDDLETEDSAASDTQIETREARVDNAVGGLGGSETCARVILGTIQNNKCLTKKKLDEWGGRRYQAVHKWPDGERSVELRDEYIDLRKADRKSGDKHYCKSYDFYEKHQKVIEEGLKLASPENMSRKKRKDGRPLELSAFQKILNAAADKSWSYVWTEIQNDPPEDANIETPGLKPSIVASRIHGGARGDYPEDALYRVRCMDIGKRASHWVDVAWTGDAIGRIVDYGVAETPVELDVSASNEAIEVAILKMLLDWRDEVMSLDPVPDLCLIDSGAYSGAKDEGGNRTQRGVYEFVRQAGGNPFAASKGWDSGKYRKHKPSESRMVGDNWNISHQPDQGLWLYNVNADFWKGWVHQRFLTRTFDDNQQLVPGSMSLFAATNKRQHVSFSKHICSEEWREEFKKGKQGMRRYWYQIHKNNHWFDALVLACAAASMLGIQLVPRMAQQSPVRPKPKPKPVFTNHTGQPYLVTER